MHKSDLILHPVRMRILVSLTGREMTALQLASEMPDIAQATLYRHINTLADAGLLKIVEENQIRGTVEKVYALAEGGDHISYEEIQQYSKAEHLQNFSNFMTTVLGDFVRFSDNVELEEMLQYGYQKRAIHLNESNIKQFQQDLLELIQGYSQQTTDEDKRYLLSTVLIPELMGKKKKKEE